MRGMEAYGEEFIAPSGVLTAFTDLSHPPTRKDFRAHEYQHGMGLGAVIDMQAQPQTLA